MTAPQSSAEYVPLSAGMPDEERGALVDGLLAARSVLLEPGVWTQNQQAARPLTERYADDPTKVILWGCRWSHPEAEKFCLLGAVAVSTRMNATGHPVHKFLAKFLRHRYRWTGTVPHWNDAKGRTVEQVLGLFDEALADLKSGRSVGASSDGDVR